MAEVLIVGAGPVGLSLALALARRGIPVRVFEAQPALSREARASTLHPPTLEMLAEWGTADAVIARGLRVSALQCWERAARELIAQFDYALIAGDTAFPFRLQCPQSTLTRVLLPAIQATGCAQVHFNVASRALATRRAPSATGGCARRPPTRRRRWLSCCAHPCSMRASPRGKPHDRQTGRPVGRAGSRAAATDRWRRQTTKKR